MKKERRVVILCSKTINQKYKYNDTFTVVVSSVDLAAAKSMYESMGYNVRNISSVIEQ